jgi:BlaI family transcriptional regulator, penicillinase repressor
MVIFATEMVKCEDGPRGYLWTARVSRKVAVSGLIGKLVQHVCDGSARQLVAHLIEEGELDDREREEILEILKSRRDNDKKPSPKKKGTSS